MVDLNSLIAPDSPLYLYWAGYITDGGEIGAFGSLSGGDDHAVLLIPCDGNHAGIEGCDYSLVEASAASSQPSASRPLAPGPQIAVPRTNHRFRFVKGMKRTEGGAQ